MQLMPHLECDILPFRVSSQVKTRYISKTSIKDVLQVLRWFTTIVPLITRLWYQSCLNTDVSSVELVSMVRCPAKIMFLTMSKNLKNFECTVLITSCQCSLPTLFNINKRMKLRSPDKLWWIHAVRILISYWLHHIMEEGNPEAHSMGEAHLSGKSTSRSIPVQWSCQQLLKPKLLYPFNTMEYYIPMIPKLPSKE